MGFGLASGADVVDTDVVLFFIEDRFQAMLQADQFFFVEETFKEAVLGPLAKTAQGLVDFGATFVVGYIVGDEVEGGHGEL